ncbi:MAG: hypothetical protein IIA45_06340 [Bacteroidetes bacterium]|nr:hypothetical protein [Bacteroidota bacterium]
MILKQTHIIAHLLILPIFLGTFLNSQAQVPDRYEQYRYAEKEFVVLIKTKDYSTAMLAARSASLNLDIPLDLRGLIEDPLTGLSFTKKLCEQKYFGGPCYVARGRFDDGIYVSIEYSNQYSGTGKNYYLVIAGSGSKGSSVLRNIYMSAKAFYPNVISKSCLVYIGLVHQKDARISKVSN